MNNQSNPNLPSMNYIELFKKIMADIIESSEAGEAIISKYFSKNYSQQVDGKKIDYHGFVRHMAAQKQLIKSAKVEFIQVIAQDNIISTIHEVTVTKRNGSQSLIKVIGHMIFEADKTTEVDELTHVIHGNDEDKNLGSIQ